MPILFTKEQTYLPIVNKAAKEWNVPPALIFAHIKQESEFNRLAFRNEPAIGDASYGLMQVLLGTAKKIDSTATPAKLYEPEFNINIGTGYIAQNLKRYSTLEDAIAAYNAGTAYKRNGRYISKTGNDVQHYVDKVMANYKIYSQWLNQGANIFDPSLISPWLLLTFLASGVSLIFIIRRRRRGKYYRSRTR